MTSRLIVSRRYEATESSQTEACQPPLARGTDASPLLFKRGYLTRDLLNRCFFSLEHECRKRGRRKRGRRKRGPYAYSHNNGLGTRVFPSLELKYSMVLIIPVFYRITRGDAMIYITFFNEIDCWCKDLRPISLHQQCYFSALGGGSSNEGGVFPRR